MDPKKLRAMLGMTQAGFAVAMGVALQTVQRWEAGQTPSGAARMLLNQVAAEVERLGFADPPDVAAFDARRKVGVGYAWVAENRAKAEESAFLTEFMRGKA